MRKEILFAIVAGAIFGLIIAFGLWRLNSTLTPQQNQDVQEIEPTPTPEFGITIAEPEQNQVIVEGPVRVSGVTKPNSWVTASAEDEDYTVQSGSDGSFELDIDLVGGVNQIIFSVFGNKGSSISQTLTIVYSTEFPLEEQTEEQEESTGSGDAVRDRVQEKVQRAQTVPYAYIGTVTDIVEDTFQVRTASGEIKQAETADETSYVNIIDDPEEIEFGDVAIGDFIVAMGFRNGNGVLDTKRVLVTTQLEAPQRSIVFGRILSIDGSDVTIEAVDKNWALDFPVRWKGPDIAELEEGQNVIVVGESDESSISLRSIFVAEETPTPTPEEEE